MISRNEFNRLEKRINTALLSGVVSQRELQFLYSISIAIDKFGRNTHLSGRQTECLIEILDRVERRL
jgi:Trp operon repressor